MLKKARALALVTSISMLALLAFAASASALPANFWGVVPQGAPSEEQLTRLKAGGVDAVRVPIDWGGIEPTRNGYSWGELDALVKRASAAGLELLPFVYGAPRWAVPPATVPGTHGAKAPARLPVSGPAASGWSAMLKQLVRRYGPNGSLWAHEPGLAKRPIRTWQIWNEPNFHYFVARPNAAQYGKLVKLSSTALKSADPGAQVILAGLFARPKGGKAKGATNPFASKFLQTMYEKTPGIRTRFDGVALHPYTGNFKELTPEIAEVRKVLSVNHDGGKGLWITELGWSSQPPPANPLLNIFAKGMRGQAQQLKGAFTLLEAKAARWKLKQVYWFSVNDQPGSCNFCDGSGLFKEGFVPKPSWFEYVKFSGGRP
jgi:hypothetical protein